MTALLHYSVLGTRFKHDENDIKPVLNFPFIYNSNIPAAPAYGVHLSVDTIFQSLLTMKLLNQGFLLVKLKSSLRKFYGRHHDFVDRYGIPVSVSQMTYMFHLS